MLQLNRCGRRSHCAPATIASAAAGESRSRPFRRLSGTLPKLSTTPSFGSPNSDRACMRHARVLLCLTKCDLHGKVIRRMHQGLKTLFLQAPSFEGFDGGAGSRYQAKREIKSFWFPTWLAQPAALVPDSRVVD